MALSNKEVQHFNHIYGAIYGVAVGDALGVPYEFCQRKNIALNPCVDMIGYGTFNKPAGTWSDDTSMTLAALEGLADMQSDDGYAAVMDCFYAWLNEGKYTTEGVFDVGRTCMDAVFKYREGVPPLECGGKGEFHNGNGSLMRIMPAVLYSLVKFDKIDDAFIADMSALTHAHEISKTACIIYAHIAEMLTKIGSSKQGIGVYVDAAVEVVQSVLLGKPDMQEVFCRLTDKSFYGLPESEIKSSGYVVDTLEAALWCLFTTKRYSACVLKAVNLGQDTDTVAAVAGGLAGLYYGKNAISKKWLAKLKGKDIINQAIGRFVDGIVLGFHIKNGVLVKYTGTAKSVVLPHYVVKIGEGAFYGNGTIESVVLSKALAEIGDDAFLGCQNLSTVHMTAALKRMGRMSFCYCEKLENIMIPSSVTEIADGVFAGCDNLKSIHISPENTKYYTESGCIIEKETKRLISAPTVRVILDDIKIIGKRAFCHRHDLTQITIPASVVKIESLAFCDCPNLAKPTAPDSVEIIEEDAFLCGAEGARA